MAASCGKGGYKLWEKKHHRKERTMTEPINIGIGGKNIMAEHRFKFLKSVYPYAFQDKDAERAGDPWHMVLLAVDGYNENRKRTVAASVTKVMDESMSAFKPQSTKTGGLPNISFVQRKPRPLGTEFKDIADAVTGECVDCCCCYCFWPTTN